MWQHCWSEFVAHDLKRVPTRRGVNAIVAITGFVCFVEVNVAIRASNWNFVNMENIELSLRRNAATFDIELCIICQQHNKIRLISETNGCARIRWASSERQDVVFQRLQKISEDQPFFLSHDKCVLPKLHPESECGKSGQKITW